MNPLIIILCILAQFGLVGGQLLLKHAMQATTKITISWPDFWAKFVAGVTSLSLWFFLWVGLLQKKDLSYIFPFESLGTVLLLLGAGIFLKVRLSPKTLAGMFTIAAGIILVSLS